MTNYRHPILAKPSGITLEQHKLNVISEGNLLFKEMPFIFEKYEKKVGKNLSKRLNIVCKYHDDGKCNEKWQIACQNDYETFLYWKRMYKGTFKDYVKYCHNEVGKNIRKAGVRHELKSLVLNKERNMPMVLKAAIAAHHGKLGFGYEERWEKEGLINEWNEFQKESNNKNENLNLEQLAKCQYEYAGPRGLLQLADRRASAKEEGDYVPDFTGFSYKFPYSCKKAVQKLIEENWDNKLLLVRAPTGAGKTDASLLWALKQIENKRADRLVIAMPTRFTSNALAVSVAESLSNTGLYHSSAWFNRFHRSVENGEIQRQKAEKLHEFARLLETPITVCTIDHLLMSLTLTREDHQLITFNLANSCLVIDEADFYDEFTQANILVLLEILRYWDVPILLMSASLPESVIADYEKIGYSMNGILEDKSDNERMRFEIKTISEYETPDDVVDLLHLMIDRGTGIIYVNTVEKAIAYYRWFQKYNETNESKIDIIVYHSRFTESDKTNKESKIIEMLGHDAWRNNIAHGIAIMTQIGEMSINISAEIMISEICPIDRLMQRAGRICRFDNKKIGDMYVLIPQKSGCLYPAPYGTYDNQKKEWSVCEPLEKTISNLKTQKYSANLLIKLLNEVYEHKRVYSQKSITNANHLKDYFKFNWLINPMQKSSINDEDVNFWQSRDMIQHDVVYVQRPRMNSFSNYDDFNSWKICNSVDLPKYLIEKGLKQHIIDIVKINIRDDETTLYVVRDGFYKEDVGIVFSDNNSINDQFI